MLSLLLFSSARTLSVPLARFSQIPAAIHSRRCGRMAMPMVAALLLSAACHSAAAQSFGSVAIGRVSAVSGVEIIIPAVSAVGSIGVLTQGSENLDFVMASGSTCKPGKYPEASKCIVNVVFRPTAAGLRMGAVVLFSGPDNTGRQVVTKPIYGNGTGPQVAFTPSSAKWIAPTVNGLPLNDPEGLAMDGKGDLFIMDSDNYRVVEVPAGGGTPIAFAPTVSGQPMYNPSGLAIDGAGDLFIMSDDAFLGASGTVLFEVPSGGGPAIIVPTVADGVPLNGGSDLTVDGEGNLFIADWYNSRLVKKPFGGGAEVALTWTVDGLAVDPMSVAVDAAGDLFIGDVNGQSSGANSRVVEVPANGGAPFAVPLGEAYLGDIDQITVDAAGDIYVPDGLNGTRIWVIPATGREPFAISPTLDGQSISFPWGLVLDRAGNFYTSDFFGQHVLEIEQSQPPTLTFPTPTDVGKIDTADPGQTVVIENIGNTDLNVSALSFPADFSSTGGGPGACDGETSVEPGKACSISVDFTPKNAGILTEFVTLTDNNLNKANVEQEIPVDGTGIQALPTAMLSTTKLSFGNQKVNTASEAKTVVLTNAGAAPLKIHSVTISGVDPKDFKLKNSCPDSLDPKNSCALDVIFEPRVKGELSAKLVIKDNALTSPQKVSLAGLAVP
jgi:hypothetical protein